MRKSLLTLLSLTFLLTLAIVPVSAQNHEGDDEHMVAVETSDEGANTACSIPAGPIIPDGNVASEDELVAASKGIKAYQESLVDYRKCLDTKQEALDPETETTVADTLAIKAAYDASIDAETAVAEEFNGAVRAFKSRQPTKK